MSGSPALSYFVRRLSQAVLVMFVVVLGNFLLIQLAPGDLVDVLGGTTDLSPEQALALRQRYGLDQPLWMQFLHYAGNLLHFDLGFSPRQGAPVVNVLLERLPTTLALVFLSLFLSVAIGTAVGVLAARRAGTLADFGLSLVVLLFYATPSFIIALLLILGFSVYLPWLPSAGLSTPGMDLEGFAKLSDIGRHFILPVIALSTFYTAIYGRLSRAAMLEVLSQDFIRTARAKGVPERGLLWRHALRNALMPIVTMAGLQVSSLLGGAVLIETVFGLPGIGRTAFDAVMERDTNMLLGVLFMSSLGVVCVNLLVDLLYRLVDPRVELA